jgi:hypothetical protein
MSGWIVTRLRRNGPTHVLSEDGRYVAQRVTPDFLPLVAAAPDLLDAARLAEAVLARDQWRDDAPDPEAVALRALRAAIASAEGLT